MASGVRTVRAGVIGFGFMGDRHARAYGAAGRDGLPVRLAAIADSDADRRAARPGGSSEAGGGGRGNIAAGDASPAFDRATTRIFASSDALIDSGEVDVVSICTPTDTHIALATRAIEAGLHVLIEKPVALEPAPVRELARLARAKGVVAMPAMCMRFWPGWSWLAEAAGDGRYGRITSARFERTGAAPGWSRAFYLDERRSGGAIFDLHIHDADFIAHLFGMPRAVRSVGSRSHVTTSYLYGDGGPAHVVAEGGWLNAPTVPFRMRYIVEFERGVADFDLSRDPVLVLHGATGAEAIDLGPRTGYDEEVRSLVRAIAAGVSEPPVTLDEAADVIDLVRAEARSLAESREVMLESGG